MLCELYLNKAIIKIILLSEAKLLMMKKATVQAKIQTKRLYSFPHPRG